MKKKLYKDMTKEEQVNYNNIRTINRCNEYEFDELFENYDFANDPNDYKPLIEERLEINAQELVLHSDRNYDIEYYKIKNVNYILYCINKYNQLLNEFYEHSYEYELVNS